MKLLGDDISIGPRATQGTTKKDSYLYWDHSGAIAGGFQLSFRFWLKKIYSEYLNRRNKKEQWMRLFENTSVFIYIAEIIQILFW